MLLAVELSDVLNWMELKMLMKMPCFLSATMDLGQFTEASLLNL